jgi:DNA-binding NarL/FixJ family response regulator
LKVVVIDDDPVVLAVVQATLEDMGHEVVTRSTALGASALILRERPEVVLVDLNMAALPGDEWLEVVEEQGLLTRDEYNVAFVVFSSREVEELESIVEKTCAIGYIHKRGGPDAFQAAFEKLLGEVGS